MTRQIPVGEAMSREGKGTAAATEAGNSRPARWEDAEERLTKGGWFWLATVRPDGAPHVMPLFAVWSESAMYVASKETARKSRNLAADGRCVITTDAGDMHLIVEGDARRVRDEATLHRASNAFGAIYGWPTVVRGDNLDAEYGAPTSGGPPYDVYEITPTKAFGLPTDGESFAPTRWRFDEYEEKLMSTERTPINVILRSEQSGGEIAVMDNIVGAGFPGPPLHHHDFDETFYVLDGELTFQLEDEIFTRARGELAFAPRNVAHTFANLSGADARTLIICTPAGFERYFDRLAAERAGGGTPPEASKPIPETIVVGPRIGERPGDKA